MPFISLRRFSGSRKKKNTIADAMRKSHKKNATNRPEWEQHKERENQIGNQHMERRHTRGLIAIRVNCLRSSSLLIEFAAVTA